MKTKPRPKAAHRRKGPPKKWHLLPDIKKLPRDSEWDAVEVRLVAHTNKHRPPFEE